MGETYIEGVIRELDEREFSPGDPRTPSVSSMPGGRPLSLENERKILEANLALQRYIETVIDQNDQQRTAFWTDQNNLQLRWEQLHALWKTSDVFPEGSLWIERGTGDVLLRNGEEFRYLDVQEGLFISQVPVCMSEERIESLITFDSPMLTDA